MENLIWRWPTGTELLWLAFLAAVATVGNFANTRALAEMDVSVVTSFDFARLPITAALAFFAFGEVPDKWTWIGAAIIAASSLYIAHRESRLERLGRKPASQPPELPPIAGDT